MDKALVMLLSKLSAVNGLPDDADTPLVRTSNSEDNPIVRLALVAKDGFDVNLEALGQYLDTNIVEPLSRTNGISEVEYRGGGKYKMRVIIDPDKLVQYQLTLTEIDAAQFFKSACTRRGQRRIKSFLKRVMRQTGKDAVAVRKSSQA